jgi:hypothetical protein
MVGCYFGLQTTGGTVGGAVAVNTIDSQIQTKVEKATLTAARDIVMESDNDAVIGNIAFSGTLGIFAAGGTVAVNTLTGETGSQVIRGADLNAGRDIVLDSRNTSVIGVVAAPVVERINVEVLAVDVSPFRSQQ